MLLWGGVELILGEKDGRVPAPVGGLPPGVMAVSVPVRRDGRSHPPRDRHGRLKIREVDLVADGPVEVFAPPAGLSQRELAFVLAAARRKWSTAVGFLGEQRGWEIAVELVQCGGMVVRCGLSDNLDLTVPLSWRLSKAWEAQAVDRLDEIRGRRNPDEVRKELLALMVPVAELAAEHARLAACEPGTPLRVPEDSATLTRAWRVYEDAIRAAAFWWPRRSAGESLTAKSLASQAWHNSKGWTTERELAFANLVGMSFDQAVTKADTELRLRGPLLWRVGQVAANAAVATPWVAVPAHGLHVAGIVGCDAEGVLLIENSDTFEQVCAVPEVIESWLCVWGRGYTSSGLLALLSYLAPRPVAAWCDLDADGIAIIDVLTRKLGRAVRPVGMDLELWRTTPHRMQTPEQIARDKQLAAKLAVNGPEPLRPLAREIANRGGSCEQEAVHHQVLQSLAEVLASLVPIDLAKRRLGAAGARVFNNPRPRHGHSPLEKEAR